ncbi:hypothetical protein FLONG3_4296 [Fusarium longipes]|uniref:Uncharacterized protein n=1 Tax=Fusarium longipes TaxID=694270 RepID=A0A395T059_9HYPO|nr:hypothetical protein FLONG3_4296 [Fusarium longipes]
MSFLFKRSEKQRRNTDDDYNKMQYRTERGSIPARIVETQMRECEDRLSNEDRKMYPHRYDNQEQVFQPYEQRNDPQNRRFFEAPINSRVDLSRKPCNAEKVDKRMNPHPNDRARVARTEVNDPGAFRGVVTADPKNGRVYGVAGVIYHPEGNTQGMRRAPMEPLDREGRQYLRRYQDDAADPMRVTTWPPRDEDGDELAMYEGRYQKVRKSKPQPAPKAKKGFFK